jgi:hypothetical protein
MQKEKEAAVLLKQKQAHEARLQREQDARDEQERQDQEARDAQAAKVQKEKERQEALQKQKHEQQQHDREAEEQRSMEQAKLVQQQTEHVDRAKKLVRQLVQLRASIQPFDENKAVSKRRLGMKKIARGKLNTLSESAQKVQEVAMEVSQAITVMRQEDKDVAERLQRGEQGVTQDMTRGKRYFLDLLASNSMSRVQAETFNGIKGDAFPLAAMLSMVSVENKDLNPILEAHIYTVCPTAIPVLPKPKHDASEDEIMTELGMQRGKDGEFESFPAFLARTEKIISFMADIMSSVPSTHTLLKGNHGAVLWLERFLDLLPPAPSAPLPLTTAPVLGAFLNAAGHMLANKHADAFKTLLATITDDIANRLDGGEIGRPSATRLNKILEGGFEHFRNELPAKAIPELYYGASRDSKRHTDGSVFGGTIGQEEEAGPQQMSASSQNPFGGSSQRSQNASGAQSQSPFGVQSQQNQSPFGGRPSQQNQSFGGGMGGGKKNSKKPCTFFAQGRCRNGDNCNYSHETGSSQPSSSGTSRFGTAPPSNPFGGANSSGFSASPSISTSSFGATANDVAGDSSSPFASGSNVASPFGNAPPPSNPSPFASSSNAPSHSGFGANPVANGVAGDSSSFSSESNFASPFGNAPAPSNPSPFASSSSAPSHSGFSSSIQSPFSSGQHTAQQSPFGGPSGSINSQPSNPSPFGGGTGTSSSFGAGNTSQAFGSSVDANPSPFGGNSSAVSPFGGGSSTQPFGSSSSTNPSPFGGSASNSATQSPFSKPNQSPFGSISQTFGSGSNTNPSPFGGSSTPSPSPFTNHPASTFGTSNTTQPFGSSANVNPSPFGGNSQQGFGSSSVANPSPFGGNTPSGLSSSGFGGNVQQNQSFGGNRGSNTKFCTYFAKGQCKFGANCKNSHDRNAGNNSGFVSSNSGFGGGSNSGFEGSSGFGGSTGFGGTGGFGSSSSGFSGGFGQSTPFGGPRR